MIVFCYGYSSFVPWNVSNFFIYYTLLILGKSLLITRLYRQANISTAPITFTFWKVFKRTSFVKPHQADFAWERPTVDAYEATFMDPPVGFWTEIVQLVGFKRKGRTDRRRSSVV
jgi:amino acid transporter